MRPASLLPRPSPSSVLAWSRRSGRPLLAAIGLSLALAGQHLVAQQVDLAVGAWLLILGTVVFAAACWGIDSGQPAWPAADDRPGSGWQPRSLGAHLLLPGLLNAAALALFASGSRPNAAWLLWVVSLALAAGIGWWVVGRPSPRLWPARELLLVLALTLVGAGFRLYRIDDLPPGLWSDEGAVGLEVLRVLQQPDYRPIFAGTPLYSPFLWFYLSAASVAWLGPTVQALRLPAIVGGILYVPIIYALARQLFGPPVAWPAAAIAAVLLWNVNFSRHGWTYDVWTIGLDALAITLLVRAIQCRRPGSALAAGLIWGLALQGYQPARLLVVVIGAFLALVAIRERRRFLRRHAQSLALFGVCAVTAASPILLFAVLRPAEYTFRQQQVFVGHEIQRAGSLAPLVESVRQHLLMFNLAGDRNGRHNNPGAPMLDQVTAALFVLGLGLAALRVHRPAWAILPIWCLVGLAGGILTLAFEAPQALRGIEAQTPAILLAAGALAALAAAGRGRSGKSGWSIELVGALLLVIAGLNFYAYFVRKANDFAAWADYSTAETIAARQVAPIATTHNVYLDDTWVGHPTIRFLAPSLVETARLDPLANIPLRDSRPAAVLLRGELIAPIEDLRQLYPAIQVDEIGPPFGGVTVVRSAVIPSSAIEAEKGLAARYTTLNLDQSSDRTERSLDLDWRVAPPVQTPFTVELTGALAIPAYGRYRFELEGPAGAVLELGGAHVVGSGESNSVQLARGNYRVRLFARVDRPTQLAVRWAPPGSATPQPIPAEALFQSPLAARGLLGRYRTGVDWSAPIQFAQIDRHLQRRVHLLPLPRPYSVEWTGQLQAERGGVYRFATDAVGRASLWIDDRPLVNEAIGRSAETSMTLVPGPHPIRVRFVDDNPFSRLDVLWAPPGGELEPIPTSMLVPPEGPIDQAAPPPPIASPPLPALGEAQVRWLHSEIAEPRGVDLADDGTVFVVDATSRQVHKLNREGQRVASWTHPDLAEPVDVAVGRDGRPWVLDAEHGWIVQFTPDGAQAARLGGPSLGLYRPRGIGIGPDGALYVANTGGQQVLKLAADGTVLARFGPEAGGPERLLQPTDVAVDGDGDLYVVTGEHHAVIRLDSAGQYRAHWPIPPSDTVRGSHLALGPDGGVYVSEPAQSRVSRYAADGQPAGIVEATRQGRLLRTPVGLAVAPDGTLFVADPALPGVLAIEHTPAAR